MNTKLKSILIALVILLSAALVMSCGTSNVPEVTITTKTNPPATSTSTNSEPYTITILHTSENHGHWEPVEVSKVSQGGIARRATLVKKLRAEIPNTLLLDSGDISQGTLYFSQYRGVEGRDLYNLLGYDAVVTGNHDFDAGPNVLADNLVIGANFKVVVSNMDFSNEPALAGKIPATIVKTVGGEKIGIFGLITEDVTTTSSPGTNIKMIDTTQAAKDAVATLSEQGINKIIMLSHLGYPADRVLASKVPGIDVIVSGHTDTLMGDPAKLDASLGKPVSLYPGIVNLRDGTRTLIIHDYVWGRQLGQINLNFNGGEIVSWDGNPIFVDKNVEEDAAVTEKLAELKAPLDELKKQIIGKTTVNLDGKRATVRNQESNLGNLIADAVLWSTERDNTQVAMINGGGIRASIPEGDITIGQVMEVLPFGNRLVQIDLKGSDIVAAIENGISTIDADPEKSGGRFLQVAGLQFKADLSKPIGSRVTEIQIGNQKTGYKPLDTNVVYRVAILDFMFTGGDGFSMFSNGKNMRGGDVPEEQVVIDYIKAKSPVEPVIEGRIELTK